MTLVRPDNRETDRQVHIGKKLYLASWAGSGGRHGSYLDNDTSVEDLYATARKYRVSFVYSFLFLVCIKFAYLSLL
jgi:hypothetical protein